ncbi:MAG: ankyrin repeat domain-containing protein [Alphaproteobacteria bacterium]|nr:ankyrin repeat domain-containing protein [Alphaproteobacteria bacterium]
MKKVIYVVLIAGGLGFSTANSVGTSILKTQGKVGNSFGTWAPSKTYPTHCAVQGGLDSFKTYLSQHPDCNLNELNDLGRSPLFVAASIGDWSVVKLLVRNYGVKIDQAVLGLAVGNTEIWRFLKGVFAKQQKKEQKRQEQQRKKLEEKESWSTIFSRKNIRS